jgi:hypothetical protein
MTAQRTLRPKRRIPHFTSIAEEAAFWDTHSLADFEDEFEPVNDVRFVVMRAGPKKPLTVRLPGDTLKHHGYAWTLPIADG